jgi:Acetylglutamate semialdehyde dehydrogenase
MLGELDQPPVIDAKSGVSGAGGRVEDDSMNYVSVNENFKAYKVFSHQHQPEIQQYLNELSSYSSDINGEVILTPHLLPVNRGILSTIYIHFREAVDPDKIVRSYSEFADKQKFVEFLGKAHFPDIKMTSHTNRCMIGIECDQSGQNLVIVSSLDNFDKRCGQARQFRI